MRDDQTAVESRMSAVERKWHVTVLIWAVAVVLLSFVLVVRDDETVAFMALPDWPLPELCATKSGLGIDCPGCGMTRSFILLAAGRFRESFKMHRLGWLLAAFVVMQVPYRALVLYRQRSIPVRVAVGSSLGIAYGLLLIGNWVSKLFIERV